MTTPGHLVLPYPPSANRYWRTRIIAAKGRPPFVSTYVSEEAQAFKADVARRIALARMPRIEGPFELAYTLYPHRPLDWATRARKDPNGWQYTVQCIDLDNASKVLLDALKGTLFDDDRWLQRISGTRAIPDQHPERVVVAVRRWNPPPVQPGLDLALPVLPPAPAAGRRKAIDLSDSPF